MKKYLLTLIVCIYHAISHTSSSDLDSKPQSELNGLLTNAIKNNEVARVESLLEAKAMVSDLCPPEGGHCQIQIYSSEVMDLLRKYAHAQFRAQ